jgi:hypothetical protein
VLTCNAGFGNCDGLAPNGCETTLTTDTLRCGTCTNSCTFANATPRCEAGGCKFTCLPNFYDLNNNHQRHRPTGPRVRRRQLRRHRWRSDQRRLCGARAHWQRLQPRHPLAAQGHCAAGIAVAKATSKRDVYLAAGT